MRGQIYLITNLINSKKYVGQTTKTMEERFEGHLKDARKEDCKNRPLYAAFNKYGIENFKVELLEEVKDSTMLNEREVFWIKELDTYGQNGYNSTMGGDGKLLYDHTEILELYNLGYSVPQVADKIGCDQTSVLKVLKANGIKSRRCSHKVDQFDLAGNYIQTFDSTNEARNWLINQGITENKKAGGFILEVCKKIKKSAYSYIWKFTPIPKLR